MIGSKRVFLMNRFDLESKEASSMIDISTIGVTSDWSPNEPMGRSHERKLIMIEIILDSSAGRRSSRISDLSLGGCFVESISNYREGEELAFELRSPYDNVLRFNGRVAYVMDTLGFGLEFHDLGQDQKEFLEEAIASNIS